MMNRWKLMVAALVVLNAATIFVYQKRLARLSDSAAPQGEAMRLAPVHKDGRILPSAYEQNEVKNSLQKEVTRPLKDCFNSWVKDHPQFTTGIVHMDWEIDPSGKVAKSGVIASDLQGIEACIQTALGQIVFPKPPTQNNVYIAHKFFFKNELSTATSNPAAKSQ